MVEPVVEPAVTRRLHSFHDLMQRRVRRILLVTSLYDSFIMSEEGHLQETLLGHFLDLNLGQTPDLVQVPACKQALEQLAKDANFDLVVSTVDAGDCNAAELVGRLRARGHEMPVICLAFTSRQLHEFVTKQDTSDLERIFLWQGDVRIFLAIVKYLEDRLNVEQDTGVAGVPAILVVEDNIRFYSSFLPSIYTELFRHTHRLIAESLNPSQKMLRMRARPKVLLCDDYEEAWDYFERYEEDVLGIISDFEFPREGRLDAQAGLELCSRALERRPGIRLVLQSSRAENEVLAEDIGASFLLKGSPKLLNDLRQILITRFGFGEFIFRGADRTAIDSAEDLKTFAEKLRTVPGDSIRYHAERNHFSNWLKTRTEFELARELSRHKATEYEDVEELRSMLLETIDRFRLEQHRSIITDFDRNNFEPAITITRIGGGALGGKARGIAFGNRMLVRSGVRERFPKVEVYVPPSAVLGTDVFDEFLEYEGLRDFAIGDHDDEEITARFLEAPFPRSAISDLRAFLQRVRYPLAVRSSSLLEDSLSQPFAGVYRTYMLANTELELEQRWKRLTNAVKRVYASAFLGQAKRYLAMTAYRLEEEKMAVMLQELVGNRHEERFYPDFAGVARSYNFYPEPGHEPEDGVVAVALGMGQTVVGGDPCLRFCPKYPRQIVTFSSVADALENSQREFHALELNRLARTGLATLQRHALDVAEQDGLLSWLGSTYCPDDNRVVDGISRNGVRLVSFAQVLKHGAFPLAELLSFLLEKCSEGTGAPVEIEFAGNLALGGRERPQFAFLQMRPMAMSGEEEEVTLTGVDESLVLCRSPRVLGNGRVDDVRDLVVVGAQGFERRKSGQVALEVAKLDGRLRKEGRPYVLIGVGRWGSSDPSLGIPVAWSQIAGARVIVEAGFEDFRVEPSQGTHFFQNLTSSSVGYFTVNPDHGEGELDWDWLGEQDAFESTPFVRLLRLEQPVTVLMRGRAGEGLILRPAP